MSNSNYRTNKNLVASQISELNLSGDGRIYGKTYTNSLQVIGNTTSDTMIVTDNITTPKLTIDENNGEGIVMNNHTIEDVSELKVDKITKNRETEINIDSDIKLGTNEIKSVSKITTDMIDSGEINNTGNISTDTLGTRALNTDIDADQHEITNMKKISGDNVNNFEIRNTSLIDGKSHTNPTGRKIQVTGGTTLEFGNSLCIENNEITPTDFTVFKNGLYSPSDFLLVNGSIDMTRNQFMLEVGGDISSHNGTIKTNRIDSMVSGSSIDFNNTTIDNIHMIKTNSIEVTSSSTDIVVGSDLDIQNNDISNVNTFSTTSINIDGVPFIPSDYEQYESYKFNTSNLLQDDWFTIAQCSDGTDKDDLRADALFVVEDRLGSRHQTIVFRSGGRFAAGHYINIDMNSWYSVTRFAKIRIAYAATNTYAGFVLQLQLAPEVSAISSSLVTLRIYQNRNKGGWNSLLSDTQTTSPFADNSPEGYVTDPGGSLFGQPYPDFLESSALNLVVDNRNDLISYTSPIELLKSLYTPKASVTNLLRYDSNQPLNVGETTTSPTGTEYIKANEPIVFKNNTNLNNTKTYLTSMSTNTKEGAVIYSRAVSSTSQNSDTFLNEFVVGGGDKTPVYMSTPTKYRMYAILNTKSTPVPYPGSDIHIPNTSVFYLTMPDLTYYDSSYSYGNIASFSNMTFGGDGFCDRIIVHPVKHRVKIEGAIAGTKTCTFEIWGVNETKGGLSDVSSNTNSENAVKFFSNTISSSAVTSFHNVPFNRDGATLNETKPIMYKSNQRLKIHKDDNYYFVPVARNTGVITLNLTYSNFNAGSQAFTYPNSTFMVDALVNIHCDV